MRSKFAEGAASLTQKKSILTLTHIHIRPMISIRIRNDRLATIDFSRWLHRLRAHGLRKIGLAALPALLLPLLIGLPAAWAEAQPASTDAVVALGRTLFFDTRLSANGRIACATCHQPERAFSDGRVVAVGIDDRLGTRNTPSLIGISEQTAFFWEGRRDSLEMQVTDPFVNPAEHGLSSLDALLEKIQATPSYRQSFASAFALDKPAISLPNLRSALAAFVRSLAAQPSPFERYQYQGETNALSAEAQYGLALFTGRAQCASCHRIGPQRAPLTDGQFHAVGVGIERIADRLPALTARINSRNPDALGLVVVNDREAAELGRYLVTGNPKDIGKFKTPSLRQVAQTAPYMHDGSVPTLAAAIQHGLYYQSAQSGRALALSADERAALVAFLKAL